MELFSIILNFLAVAALLLTRSTCESKALLTEDWPDLDDSELQALFRSRPGRQDMENSYENYFGDKDRKIIRTHTDPDKKILVAYNPDRKDDETEEDKGRVDTNEVNNEISNDEDPSDSLAVIPLNKDAMKREKRADLEGKPAVASRL